MRSKKLFYKGSNPMKTIAIIPARGGSKRLPRKNILPLGGEPMLSYPVRAALESGVFDEVYVSSDDDDMNAVARQYGATTVDRPAETATDTAHELSAVNYLLDGLDSDPVHFCVIYPTAAFILPEDLTQSYDVLRTDEDCDVLMSVSDYDIHPYKALVQDENGYWQMMFPKECKMRSQHYPKTVASNGTFYWFKTSSYRADPTYYPETLKTYVLPSERAIDIDTRADYEYAQKMFELIKHG